jgi:hypothetical protein
MSKDKENNGIQQKGCTFVTNITQNSERKNGMHESHYFFNTIGRCSAFPFNRKQSSGNLQVVEKNSKKKKKA